MEELKTLMKDAFYSAVRMNAWYDLGGSEEDFNEYWNKESTQKAVKNIAVLDVVKPSLLDNVKEIAFGDGSAQERMVGIKALFSNEA